MFFVFFARVIFIAPVAIAGLWWASRALGEKRPDAFASFHTIVADDCGSDFSCAVAAVNLLCYVWLDVLHTQTVAPALFLVVACSQRETVVFFVSPWWLHLVTLTVVSPQFHLLSEACCVTGAASIYLLISRTWVDIHLKEKKEMLQQVWNYEMLQQQQELQGWIIAGDPKFLFVSLEFTWGNPGLVKHVHHRPQGWLQNLQS